MANIAATDITYTVTHQRRGEDGRRRNIVTLAFGDASLTYPSGGVPITKAKLGCPNTIESLTIFDKGTSGYEWSYDRANEKLVALQAPAQTHAHDLLVLGGGTIVSNGTIGVDALTQLVKAEANNVTFAKADVATKGGVQSETLAAAALGQPSAVAIAAQTLKVEVVGW